jgi:hypothetical protein
MNQEEIDLEAALRRALKRQEPRADFAKRVLARTVERRRQAATRVWMAIAAMLVAGVLITAGVRNYERQREAAQYAAAQKAGHDLALALRITSAKLHVAHRMIRRRTDGV